MDRGSEDEIDERSDLGADGGWVGGRVTDGEGGEGSNQEMSRGGRKHRGVS